MSLLWLRVHADLAAWRSIGLTVGSDGMARIGMSGLQLIDASPAGLVGWTLGSASVDGGDGDLVIDGLDTRLVHVEEVATSPPVDHELGARRIDHVVVMTPSIDRTCGAIADATGASLKRIREVGGGVRQGFHRLGEVIVEVVERPDIPADTPACFWGLVLIVDDLPAVAERLGPTVLGPVKAAVQPGRLITTVRNEAGLGLPVALMSA
jgi:hypothetical protein